MKYILILILLLVLFLGGFILGKQSNRGSGGLLFGDKDIVLSTIADKANNAGDKKELSKKELLNRCQEYVITGNSGDLMKYDKGPIITLIDNAKNIFPDPGSSFYVFFHMSLENRMSTLKSSLTKLEKNTMGYVTVSDFLNGTHLCESFPKRQQCIDQLEFIVLTMGNKIVGKEDLTLNNPIKIMLYALQKDLSKDAYLKLIQELTGNYCNGLEK